MAALSRVETLSPTHDTTSFECGKPELTIWLRRHALPNQGARGARTFVVHRDKIVVGYYSLAASSVERKDAPARVRKGLGAYSIPVILLARLAVDEDERGTGLGVALLKDALLRAEKVADQIGARAVLVHALDDEAKSFYEHFGFEPSPTDRLHLYLLMKDLRAVVQAVTSTT